MRISNSYMYIYAVRIGIMTVLINTQGIVLNIYVSALRSALSKYRFSKEIQSERVNTKGFSVLLHKCIHPSHRKVPHAGEKVHVNEVVLERFQSDE